MHEHECGIADSCGDRQVYQSMGECKAACESESRCQAFSWEHLDSTDNPGVCTLLEDLHPLKNSYTEHILCAQGKLHCILSITMFVTFIFFCENTLFMKTSVLMIWKFLRLVHYNSNLMKRVMDK